MICDVCEEVLEYDYILLFDTHKFCCDDCLDEFIKDNSSLIDISRN